MIKKNTGKPFEETVATIALQYERDRVLSLRKVDPPTRVIWKFGKPLVIMLPCPFPDFCGAWLERGGRSLFLEAKSTSEPKLQLDGSSGLTHDQIHWLKHWELNGAAVGVLWGFGDYAAFVTLQKVRETLAGGVKHLKFHEQEPLKQGERFVIFDFAPQLRAAYPEN